MGAGTVFVHVSVAVAFAATFEKCMYYIIVIPIKN